MLMRAWIRWLAILLFWTLLGLFFASQSGLTYLYQQGWAPWGLLVKLSLSEWYIWALLTPVAVWLAKKFPFARGRRIPAMAVHLLAGATLTMAKIVIEGWVRNTLLGIPGQVHAANKFHLSFLAYWAIVGVTHAFAYYQMYRERELAASQLQTQLARAQLQALQMQLQPHFLFNTLHAISTLMHRDVNAAERMLAGLSDLLRLTLENAGTQEVRLRSELELLDLYLEIEQTRFQDRLTVRKDIEPQTLDAVVPNLLLQPLVENAVRHGVAARALPGWVEISARRADARLYIEVSDNGPGLPASYTGKGLGLSNTRARLERLYGEQHSFRLENLASGGVRVCVEIPWRTAGEPG